MMRQSSWGCTIFIQLSLCLVVYVSLHLGHPFLFSSDDGDNAGALDLHFISVAGGFRPLRRQTRLLRLMERVAETYKAKFVVSTSEHGEEDPLLQNRLGISNHFSDLFAGYSSLLFTETSMVQYEERLWKFQRAHQIAFWWILGCFVETGSLQQEILGGALNDSMISQLKGLTRILKAADGDWRILVGSSTVNKRPDEAKGVSRTFLQIMTKYGVNLYISEKGRTSGASDNSFSCITVPNQSENRGSLNDSKREMEDGFLLHRVSFSEFVTYTISLSGQVIDTRLVKQKGKEAI